MAEPQRRLRIAEVLPAGVGPYSGITTVVIEIAIRLARLGHSIELWPLSPWSWRDRENSESDLEAAGVVMVDGFPSLRRRIAALRERSVDIVHLHSVFTPPNTFLARRLRPPFVLTPHGGYNSASLGRSALRKRLYARFLERPMVTRASAVVGLTEVEVDDIKRIAPRARTGVIPNGVTLPEMNQGAPRRFRDRHSISRDANLILYVGRLDIRHKGLDRLVSALAEAPEWECALVGPSTGPEADEVRRLAKEAGVDGRLHLIGPAHGDDLTDAFNAADLFALLSRWEGLPMSLLEAAAHGLPALVSDEVNALVPVEQSEAGWAVPAPDAGRKLRDLSQTGPEEFSRRAAAARKLAEQYDWDGVTEAYEQLFRSVARGD